MGNNPKTSASYWGRIAGGNLAGGAAFLAATHKIPKFGGRFGGVARFGAGLAADQVASASGEAAGAKFGAAIDHKTGHKVVDLPKENAVQELERTGGETLGFLGGASAGAKHGLAAGVTGGVVGAVGGNYIAGRIAHAVSKYNPEVARRIHRGAMT